MGFFATEMSLKNVPLKIEFNVLYNKFITVLLFYFIYILYF